MNGLKIGVGEFVFSGLMVSIVIALISAAKTLVKLLNAYSSYLRGMKERRFRVAGSAAISYLFSIYMGFFSLNEAYLLGLFNEQTHEAVCKVYVTNGLKTDICIEYEESMRNEKSVWGRALFFL